MHFPVSATDYFRKLHETLMAVNITDAAGATMTLDEGTAAVTDKLLAVREQCGLVALVGNGGSAAIADHMHNDLGISCGMRALVFTNTPSLTAASNDFGYTAAYERQLSCWCQHGGILIAISSSGASENILRATRLAREQGMTIVSLTGFKTDNPLRALGDLNFYIASSRYGEVELAHSCLTHYISDRVLEALRNR